MKITKWNIWHCYSTSIVGPLPELDSLARAAVDGGIASLSISRDGHCWYKVGTQTRSASCALGFVPNRAEGLIEVPPEMSPYAQECLLSAMSMRVHEQHVIADPHDQVTDYVRFYFDECVLEFGDFTVQLYPQAKLYEDGILLLEFRILSGSIPYGLDAFVEEQVNLFTQAATGGEVPLGIMVGAASHGFANGRWRLRMTTSGFRKKMRDQFGQLKRECEDENFAWQRVGLNEIWTDLLSLDLAPYNLHALANLHLWSILDTAAQIDWKNRRQRALGEFWSGRPSVYVAGTEPRIVSGTDLLDAHPNLVSKILSRSSVKTARNLTQEDCPNLRAFGDYALFANRGVTLWIGLDDSLFEQARISIDTDVVVQEVNLEGFVSTKQVQVEFLEYWYMSHRALQEKSMDDAQELTELARMERKLAALNQQVEEVPPSGEVADYFKRVGNCLNVVGIRELVRSNLRYREVTLQERRDRRNNVFGAVLAVLLASTGAPAIAESFVRPLWQLASWPHPHEETTWELFSCGIAFCVLAAFASVAAWAIHGKKV